MTPTVVRSLSVDDPQFSQWCAAFAHGLDAGHTLALAYTPDELRAFCEVPGLGEDRVFLAAQRDGRILGVALVELPLMDNTSLAYASICVPPEFRRQGVGSLLAGAVTDLARQRERVTILGYVRSLHAGGPGPGVGFATSLGARLNLEEQIRVREGLPRPARLRELALQARPHWEQDYELVSVTRPLPAEYEHAFGELSGTLLTEAPAGEMAVEASVVTSTRLQAQTQWTRLAGRTNFMVLAFHRSSGALVAYTEISYSPSSGLSGGAGTAWQDGTLVNPEHRGHRLGLAVKVANLENMQASGVNPQQVVTFNAASNAPMIAINDLLGFSLAEANDEYELDLSGPPAR